MIRAAIAAVCLAALLFIGGGARGQTIVPGGGGSSGGVGCTVAGSAGQLVYNNGSTGCLSSAATITSGGAITAAISDKGGQVYNPVAYGVVAGDVDTAGANSTAMLALMATVNTGGGGTISFPAAATCYRVDAQALLPNDGASPQSAQNNIRLTASGGGGGAWYGVNAACLDLRYVSGNQNAKIETRGTGTLEIDHLTVRDLGASNPTPFVHSTNTTVIEHDNTFIGSGNVAQDFNVLGGTTTTVSTGVNSPFQGYGTRIWGNHFRNGNRGLYGLTYANAIYFKNNTFQGNTGTVAIELDGSNGGGQTDYGNLIGDNSIEMDIYQYGVKLTSATENYLGPNGMYDPGVNVLSYYYIGTGSTQNHIEVGTSPVSKTFATGTTVPLASTTIVGSESAQLDSSGKGFAASEMAYGLVVKGTYDGSKSYPGPLTVSELFNQTMRVSMGIDSANTRGVVDAMNGATGWNLALNPLSLAPVIFPNKAGATTTAAGGLIYDTTNKNFHAGANGVDNLVPLVVTASPLVNTNFVKASVSGGVVTLIDGGSSAGNPSNYQTSTTFAGIGPTAFTPTHTLDVFDNTATTGATDLYIKQGAGQSGAVNLFDVQYSVSANDRISINSGGTLVGATNATGTMYQLVASDASLRMNSTGRLVFNSTTSLTGGALDTGISRVSAGVIGIGTSAQGSVAGTISLATIINGGITTDATHTDATVCEDTTSHQYYFGSGTAGICLGTSSARFKHGIAPLGYGLDAVMALRPISYYLNADHGDPTHELFGFTAEQMRPVVPELVGLDQAGKPNTADYVGLIPVLVRAVQELNVEVEALKAQVANDNAEIVSLQHPVPYVSPTLADFADPGSGWRAVR